MEVSMLETEECSYNKENIISGRVYQLYAKVKGNCTKYTKVVPDTFKKGSG